jgi:hypothetical protein
LNYHFEIFKRKTDISAFTALTFAVNELIMAVTKVILEKWLAAQKRHRLSDKQVQMARELGLNPDKLGKIDNHRQEPWKAPLPQFIEDIYFKRFKREEPETVRPLKHGNQEAAAEKGKGQTAEGTGCRFFRDGGINAGLHIPLYLPNVGDAGGIFHVIPYPVTGVPYQ